MSESQIQSAIMDYLDLVLPWSIRAFHINNTPRSAVHGAKLKRMGMKRGVADIGLVRSGGFIAFLEVKTTKGRQSPEQVEWQEWATANAIPYAVVRSVGDVQAFLRDLNIPTRDLGNWEQIGDALARAMAKTPGAA